MNHKSAYFWYWDDKIWFPVMKTKTTTKYQKWKPTATATKIKKKINKKTKTKQKKETSLFLFLVFKHILPIYMCITSYFLNYSYSTLITFGIACGSLTFSYLWTLFKNLIPKKAPFLFGRSNKVLDYVYSMLK